MVLAESCCSDTGHRYGGVVSMIRAHTLCATSSVAEHAQVVVARVVRATSRVRRDETRGRVRVGTCWLKFRSQTRDFPSLGPQQRLWKLQSGCQHSRQQEQQRRCHIARLMIGNVGFAQITATFLRQRFAITQRGVTWHAHTLVWSSAVPWLFHRVQLRHDAAPGHCFTTCSESI